MDLLDRYLQAVKKHLPWKRQDDILAELRANLESQLEEREMDLGRPLTQQEVEAWLKEIGAPIQVAARYKAHQYLIGPSIFPIYWFVLRLVCLWTLAAFLVADAVLIAISPTPGWRMAMGFLGRTLFGVMNAAAWLTLAFAAFEFARAQGWIAGPSGETLTADWSPGKLPPVEKQTKAGKGPRSYAQAVAEVIFGVLLMTWLLLLPAHPVLLFGPGVSYLHVSDFVFPPAVIDFYWLIVVLNALQVAWKGWMLLRGKWDRSRMGEQVVFKVFGLIPLVILLTAQNRTLIVIRHPEVDVARYGAIVDGINHWSHIGLLIVLMIAGCQLGWDVVQLALDSYRRRVAPADTHQ